MIIGNQVVTFLNPNKPLIPLTAHVQVYDAAKDSRLTEIAVQFRLAVKFPPKTTYSDGSLISGGHTITWTLPNGLVRSEALSEPRYAYGLLPYATCYFDSIA